MQASSFVLLLLAISLAPVSARSQDWSRVRDGARDSVVFIETVRQKRDGTDREAFTASGFVVSCHGHVMTVAHAVPRARENEIVYSTAAVRSRENKRMHVEVITRDDNLDVALLLLPNVNAWKPLDFAEIGAPEDAALYVLGFPLRSDLSSAVGLLSSGTGVAGRWQTTLPLNFGNSGGPVFNASGKVVAVAAGGFDQAQAITYVIPAEYLRNLRNIVPTAGCAQPPPPDFAAQFRHILDDVGEFQWDRSSTVWATDSRRLEHIKDCELAFHVVHYLYVESSNGNRRETRWDHDYKMDMAKVTAKRSRCCEPSDWPAWYLKGAPTVVVSSGEGFQTIAKEEERTNNEGQVARNQSREGVLTLAFPNDKVADLALNAFQGLVQHCTRPR